MTSGTNVSMGQVCGSSGASIAPLEPLEDDGEYLWCEDLDAFMAVIMKQGDVFGIPSESVIEMASHGLLDCPFNSRDEMQSWYTFRHKIYTEYVCKKNRDNSVAFENKYSYNKDNPLLPIECVNQVAAETLGHSPYLLMRANQFVFRKYGKGDISENENPDEDAASVEEDYNVDIVNSEADLGI